METREVLGVPLALTDYDGAIARIDELIDSGERGYLCAAAVHVVMEARKDPAVMAALRGATAVLPDGRPLVWALNRLGEPRLSDRVYGPETMRRYCQHAAATDRSIYLFGGHSQAALARLEQVLRERNPGIEIAGSWRPPYASLDDLTGDEIAERINAARADVVWVGLGAPRQELWMAAMRDRLDAAALVGVGAAFDFLAGIKKQAPAWMQRHGLEWAYRAAQEPRRLGPRYARTNPAFVAAFARQYARERRAGTIGQAPI
jgi:N-acetylglucosaminyldiphosphoundecaprenol N-acetyl-beta-D-mannosaminyltransferase